MSDHKKKGILAQQAEGENYRRASVPVGPPTQMQKYIANDEADMVRDSKASRSLWNAPRERKAAQMYLQNEAESAMKMRKAVAAQRPPK